MFSLRLYLPLPFSKRKRESRFASFYAYREPTFDLILEDRLPSCVSHTSTFECNSVVYETGMGAVKERMWIENARGYERGEEGDDIVMQY